MKKTIKLTKSELNRLITEEVKKRLDINPNQTDIESTIISMNFANLMYQLSQNYDLQLNYDDDLNDYAHRIEDICQSNKQLKTILQNFNNAAVDVLKAFGTYENQ